MKKLIQILEAIIFASGKEISKSDIFAKLPDDVSRKQLNEAIVKLKEKYSGDSGVLLIEVNDKLQFCSNDAYGDIVTSTLQIVKQKELTKVLIEVLSIIAYRQPITKSEIEEIRKTSSDYAMYMLQKGDMIEPYRHRDTPGRPIEYRTTEEFLKRFQLSSLSDLPDYDEVMKYLEEKGNFRELNESLYNEKELSDNFSADQIVASSDYMNAPTASDIVQSVLGEDTFERYSKPKQSNYEFKTVDEEGDEIVHIHSDELKRDVASDIDNSEEENVNDDELQI